MSASNASSPRWTLEQRQVQMLGRQLPLEERGRAGEKGVVALKWTETMISEAISMRERGLSSAVIAERIGMTRNAVVGKLWRIGVRGGDVVITSQKKASRRGGSVTWSEEKLTETWADRKIRRAQERAAA